METARKTLRQILDDNAKQEHPINPTLLVEVYVEDNDMTLTADDKKAIEEHGMKPFHFMQFSDSQCDQLDAIEGAIDHLLRVLLDKPHYLRDKEIDIPDFQQEEDHCLSRLEMASVIALNLADAGYTVFFPGHEVDSDGTERMLDIY